MKLSFVIFIFAIFITKLAQADSEIPPFAKVDKPDYGSCYVKQIPASIRDGVEDHLVVAFKILSDGTDEFLWKSSGWYAHSVFLSNDCQYMVRMGNWARGREPSPEDLAVAFYDNGELLRSYATSDLIAENGSVDASIGHYIWQSEDIDFPNLEVWSDTFYIKTIEDKIFAFNYKTGSQKATD